MKYDKIIIIGAGLSGLSCGAYLSKNGFDVTIIERLRKAGGVVDSFKRGGWLFEATTHQTSYHGGPDNFKNILEMAGITNTEFIADTNAYSSYFYNNGNIEKFVMPTGEDTVTDKLYSTFPKYKNEINDYIQLLKKSTYNLANISEFYISGNLIKIDRDILNYLNKPYIDIVKISNKKLNTILSQCWLYTGSKIDEVSALSLLGFQGTFLLYPPFLFKDGSRKLINKFEEKIKLNGGKIEFNSTINKIKILNENEFEILTNKKAYKCSKIIASCDPVELFYNMIGEEFIPNYYKKRLCYQIPSAPTFNVYVGTNDNLRKYGIEPGTNIINFTSNNTTKGLETIPNNTSTIIFTNYTDDVMDNGSRLMITEYDNYNRWKKLSRPDYLNLKKETQEFIIQKVENILGIKINKKDNVIFSSTPLTIKRYSANESGFMGSRIKWLAGKLKPLDFETPIKNLYMVGSNASHAGVSLAIESGILVGNKIIRGRQNVYY